MRSYIVQSGDTLSRIAKRFGVTVSSIINANPQLANMDYIIPGQVLQIPNASTQYYVIQAGDTFYGISQKFNIQINDLISANPNVNPQRLLIGQRIVLPNSSGNSIVDTTSEYGYKEMVEDIDALKKKYPFLEVVSLGKSVMGKDIWAIKNGEGPKKVHYNGSFHANEWITTVLLMKFIEDYAKAYSTDGKLRGSDMKKWFNNTSLWIVPMVNPDGVELVQEGITEQHPYYKQLLEWNNGSFNFSGWKANIRGVDLNDQFPANWEEEKERRAATGPGPRDWVGPYPLSEPEAKTIANFTRNNNFDMVIAFHTQGEEIYWNYRDLEPPISEEIANHFQSVSGYRPIKLTGSDAGYKDWFIQDFRRPGYTVEAGRGINPLPIADFPRIYNEVIGIMVKGLKVV
ncbi:M14 family zinc carboxypeptidase [Chengkuizengella sp. SCS-71B]|uniref:M14 family zinc carboxypeptidase n=1 Tax=Chengkuizengella sp. SCS-71B TaxID=3115290 RepID=UPI0032C23198